MGNHQKDLNAGFFRNDREARFLRRPNRFLIIAESGGRELVCHCPNPGRLTEFLFPGAELILEKRKGPDAEKAKTAWTAAAFCRGRTAAPIYASRANKAAEILILPKIIPGLESVEREHQIGKSRFDFLCRDNKGILHLVEVKACSLVEHGTAMFPDAPSSRALRHFEELVKLRGQGFRCHILFVILHGSPDKFIPNLHTDPAFAAALSGPGKDQVELHAALLRVGKNGEARIARESVAIDLSFGELAGMDRGNYLIVLRLSKDEIIETGSLGKVYYERGWYVYSGSGQKNLTARINRHLRKSHKKKHWHLDYLTPYGDEATGLRIAGFQNLECCLARDLENQGGRPIPGFGASDCRCKSHLYYFRDPPMENREFIDLVFYYRHTKSLCPGDLISAERKNRR